MSETWKPIEWPEGWYSVSDQGRVYSHRRNIFLRPQLLPKGYRFVRLGPHGDQRNFYIHHLVMKAFAGETPEGFEINHKDLDKSHNAFTNLEFMTHADNQKHAADAGVFKRMSMHRVTSKLSMDQVKSIKSRLGSVSHIALAHEYKVSPSTICDINKGRIWSWI